MMFNSVFMRPTPQFKKLIYSSIILGDYKTFLSCAMQFSWDLFQSLQKIWFKNSTIVSGSSFLFSGIFAMDSVTQKSVRFEEYLRNFKFHSNVESARQTALLNKWGSWGILFILENYFSSLRNRLIRALGGHSHWELIKIHGNGRIEGFGLEYLKMLNFVFFT